MAILVLTRRMADTPAAPGAQLDLVGSMLSASGLALVVYGVLRSGTWGFIEPRTGAPEWLGISPVFCLVLGGGVVLFGFAGGIPFVSDADLETALADTGIDDATADVIVDENADARLTGLRASLSVMALFALVALFATRRISARPAGSAAAPKPVVASGIEIGPSG